MEGRAPRTSNEDGKAHKLSKKEKKKLAKDMSSKGCVYGGLSYKGQNVERMYVRDMSHCMESSIIVCSVFLERWVNGNAAFYRSISILDHLRS